MLQDEDQVELNAYTGIVKVFEAPPTQKNLRIKGKVFYKGKVSGQIVNVKTDDDLTIMLENLSSAMSKSEFADEIKERYDTLSYIDLRFDNKVIYKFE